MRRVIGSALLASALAFASPAAASTVVTTKCVSVAHPDGCLFDGNINSSPNGPNGYLSAQDAYNAIRDPDITLNALFSSNDAGFPGTVTGSTSGTWSLPGYLVDFIAVKAAEKFVLYQITPASSGTWDTFDIPYKKNPHGLSHIVFFGSQTGVPEPGTWAMMIAGFGMVGAAMRRRKKAQSDAGLAMA